MNKHWASYTENHKFRAAIHSTTDLSRFIGSSTKVLIEQTPVRFNTSTLMGVTLLCVALSLAFALKFTVVHPSLSLGDDPGNYLVTMNAIFGGDPTGLGLGRPPLIAFPLKLFTLTFGILTGIKVLAVAASVSIGIPFYLLARRFMGTYLAVVVTLLFVFSSSYSSMVTWGFLSFFGIFFILLTLHLLLRVLEAPSRKYILLTGLSASLLVGFHQVSAVAFLALAGVFILIYRETNRQKFASGFKPLVAVAVVGGILSLLYLPSYLLAASEAMPTESAASLITFRSFQAGLDYLTAFFPNTPLAVMLFTAALAGMAFSWREDHAGFILLLVILLMSLATAFFSVELPGARTVSRRLPYLAYIPLWVFAGAALARFLTADRLSLPAFIRKSPEISSALLVACSAIIGVFLALEIPDSQRRLQGALNFYSYLDQHQLSALNWIKENSAPEDNFVAHSKAFGWWIEGFSRRNAFETRAFDSFFRTQHQQSIIADLVLSRNQGIENGMVRAAVTDPFHARAGGTPVIGVHSAGQYQDVVIFHDADIRLEVRDGPRVSSLRLFDSAEVDTRARTAGNGQILETNYKFDGLSVVRTIEMYQGDPAVLVSYHLKSGTRRIQQFTVDLNLALGRDIQWEQTGDTTFRKRQRLRATLGQGIIITNVSIDARGAAPTVEPSGQWPDHAVASFDLTEPEARVRFHFKITAPRYAVNEPVRHFSVSQLAEENNITYIALDTRSESAQYADVDLPWRTESWLNENPHLKLAFEDEDVKVYRIIRSDFAHRTD